MCISRMERGMLAKSKAGHDKDRIYVICDFDETYVYLVDGKTRTLAKPKKKKIKHVQVICKQECIDRIDDICIKRRLKLLDKEIRRI